MVPELDDLTPPVRRKRGGQPGNRNNYRHGAFSRATMSGRQAARAQLRQMELLIKEVMAEHEREQHGRTENAKRDLHKGGAWCR